MFRTELDWRMSMRVAVEIVLTKEQRKDLMSLVRSKLTSVRLAQRAHIVLCCDEKSQVQTLDCIQPGLPLKKGRASTMTHDYKRNGTTTLFATLDILDGTVIARSQQRHRHDERLRFLKKVDRETSKDKRCT